MGCFYFRHSSDADDASAPSKIHYPICHPLRSLTSIHFKNRIFWTFLFVFRLFWYLKLRFDIISYLNLISYLKILKSLLSKVQWITSQNCRPTICPPVCIYWGMFLHHVYCPTQSKCDTLKVIISFLSTCMYFNIFKSQIVEEIRKPKQHW